jgi:predicted nucleic acid-binding protein
MHILFDINIVLDVLLKRKPWVTEAIAVWRANDEGQIIGYILASAMTDIFYIARRLAGLEIARTTVRTCLEAFEICTVDRQALEQAEALPGNDFEDNLQIACANIAGIDAIVTRDKDGFKTATIPVWTPAELLTQLH